LLDLSNKPDLRPIALVIGDMRRAAPAKWRLVGAMARDLRLTLAHGIEIARRTNDVDLALAVDGWGDYAEVRRKLLDSDHFADTAAAQRMRHRSGWSIDVIPFDGIEGPDGTFAWPPDGDVRSRVPGGARGQRDGLPVPAEGEQIIEFNSRTTRPEHSQTQ
jgi:predicted nucleotidyltransferase